jgi:uncharacterized protein YecA (UPF0149 family)
MAKPGRNELCSCGSGKKYKRCHGLTSESTKSGRFLMIAVGVGVLAAVVAGVAAFTTDRSSSVRVWDPAHGHYHDASGTQVP